VRKGKIRWGAVLNAVVGTVAVLGSPEVTAILPAHWAHGIAVLTLINATFIKPALRTETERRKP
jgi:hypothetical protein